MPIDLNSVDELIAARKELHGGERGAPLALTDGGHEGAALNRACVVMLSAALQAHVGEVFSSCSNKAFGRVLADDELKAYRGTWSRWEIQALSISLVCFYG